MILTSDLDKMSRTPAASSLAITSITISEYCEHSVYTNAHNTVGLHNDVHRKLKGYSSSQHDLPLRELTWQWHMGSHSVTCHPAEVTLLPHAPHLKYAATLPFNLSLRACFADINVLQGSVATYARCGGVF